MWMGNVDGSGERRRTVGNRRDFGLEEVDEQDGGLMDQPPSRAGMRLWTRADHIARFRERVRRDRR